MLKTEPLALDGGPATKTTPYGTGKRFADNELKYLEEALAQNTLFYGHGEMVKRACEKMQAYTGRPFVVACSSGTAAIHLGLIAAGIGPGDEVICTPNTDAGSVIGIMEEGAVPVFCDPEFTLQPSPGAIEEKITDRTKAVEVIHLAGYPAPIDQIQALCDARGIALIEDCAQSWGTRIHGRLVGTWGVAGCYSLNDYKHISAGDGGFVALEDEQLYRRVSNYADKHYDRLFDLSQRQAHHAMNYRMSELQGAVALAQLEKVDRITSRQHELGDRLYELLKPLKGAKMVQPIDGAYATYWWTAIFIDPAAVTVSRDRIVEALGAEGIACGAMGNSLYQTPLFQERIVRPWLEDDRKYYPLSQPDGREYFYSIDDTPRHKRMMQTGVQLGLNTFYTDQDIEETARGILKVLAAYAR